MNRSSRTLRRALGALLRMYPPDYRHQVGQEVIGTHVDRVTDAAARGGSALVASARAIVETAAGAPVEWLTLLHLRLPRDLGIAVRTLSRRPGSSAVIVLTLALGIGANTAVFSLIDAILLHPVAAPDSDRLVAIYDASPRTPNDGVPYPTYRELAAGTHALSGLAASMTHDAALDLGARSETTAVTVVSGNYFPVLGLRPQVGRLLTTTDEGAPMTTPVAVVSDALWDRLWQRSPAVAGSTIRLGATTFTVVGVAPRRFRGIDLSVRQDVWVPVTMIQGLDFGAMYSGRFSATLLTTFRGFGWLQLVGRLRPDARPADVTTDLNALMAARRPLPAASTPPSRLRAVPIADAASVTDHDGVVAFSRLLTGVVALLLVLACLNVASLLSVRTAARERELGLLAALGASRTRLAGQMLIESLVLAVTGGLVGIAVGRGCLAALAMFTLPGDIAVDSLGLSLDPRLLSFALLLSLVTTIACGLRPALRAGRSDPLAAFRSVRAGWTHEPRGLLVALQVAIVVVIVVTASLFVRSLRAGLSADVGFDPAPVAAASVEPRLRGYSGARAAAFYTEVVDRLRKVPGITAAAVTSHLPIEPEVEFGIRASTDAATAAGGGRGIKALAVYVTPGYFAALGVPILAGRDLAPADDRVPVDQAVVVVNQSAARLLWSDGRGVGHQLIDLLDRPATIVGVVPDMNYTSLHDRGQACVYYSASQQQVAGRMYVIARSGNTEEAVSILRSVITAIDPRLPIAQTFRVRDHVDRWLAPQQFGSTLLSGCAVIALAIAGVGIYATLAWRVTLRRPEFGVRRALGAGAASLIFAIVRRTGAAVAAGMTVGFGAALVVARGVNHFLFHVSWFDPAAMLATFVIVTVAVLLVIALPVLDALTMSPIDAMRTER